MIDIFDEDDLEQEIVVNDGKRIVLFGCLGKKKKRAKEERARNVYLLDSDGKIVWRITSQNDKFGDPFIGIFEKKQYYICL